jgi:TetR/AcrR family transcriptional repressor of nem operon
MVSSYACVVFTYDAVCELAISHTKPYVNPVAARRRRKPISRASSGEAPRSREETMQVTREALIAAGIELFGEQGLDGPSLDAICDRAGYTRGAFYVHFADRDDFLVAVMERVGTRFLDAVLGAAGAHEDLGTTVQRFIASVMSGAYPLTPKGGIRPHQLLDACARSPAIRARYVALVEDSITRVSRMVRSGQDAHLLRADASPDDVASILLAAVIGAQTMLELKVDVDLSRTASTMLSLLAARAPASKLPRRARRREAARS